jgi:NAD(P)-dependent dehydrogenase (short-subunit alcohol dehydrogenase family)
VARAAAVTLWDRDEAAAKQAAEALGDKAFAVKVDVSEQPSVAKPWPRRSRMPAHRRAGQQRRHHRPQHKVWDYPVDDWRQVMEVNLNGVFLCCREVVGRCASRATGRIVNIASVAGKDGNPNASAYSASKAAVIGSPSRWARNWPTPACA